MTRTFYNFNLTNVQAGCCIMGEAMLTLRDVLVLAEVVRAVGLAALRATAPPAGHTGYDH